jgi:glycosyl transferase family 1
LRIIYYADHRLHDNDDEGAIAWALEQLGHEVVKVQEGRPVKTCGDFCLFHHWAGLGDLEKLACPKVFWCFDLISSTDPELAVRFARRADWLEKAKDVAAVGFLTDGDAVDRDRTGKLVWLPQGMDGRKAGFGVRSGTPIPVLFTGWVSVGETRRSFVAELARRYGRRFAVVGNDGPNWREAAKRRKHGEDLANLLASASVVVAPDGPITDRYWSNRIYITLGLGGFLLHPYCAGLASQYVPGKELVFYQSRAELLELIDYYLDHCQEREELRLAGFFKTMQAHTYKHRCVELLNEVRRRL